MGGGPGYYQKGRWLHQPLGAATCCGSICPQPVIAVSPTVLVSVLPWWKA